MKANILPLLAALTLAACSFPVNKQLASDIDKRPAKTSKFLSTDSYYADKPAAKKEKVAEKEVVKAESKSEVKERIIHSELVEEPVDELAKDSSAAPAAKVKKEEIKAGEKAPESLEKEVVFEYPGSKKPKSSESSGYTSKVEDDEEDEDSAKADLYNEEGLASWYGPRFHGRKTANGEIFNQNAMTAAHRKLPLGSMVEVTNPDNGKTIIVRINDRGPYSGKRIIDLSKAAAAELDIIGHGVAKVKVRQVK